MIERNHMIDAYKAFGVMSAIFAVILLYVYEWRPEIYIGILIGFLWGMFFTLGNYNGK